MLATGLAARTAGCPDARERSGGYPNDAMAPNCIAPPGCTRPRLWGTWGPEVRDDPVDHLAAARAACPVQPVRLPDGVGAWVVLGHDAARQALRDPRLSKDMLAALARNGEVVAPGLPGPAFARHMLAVDPPEHTRLRRLAGAALTAERVAALEPAIRWRTIGLLDRSGPGGRRRTRSTSSRAFAHPLPFGVIGDLVGIPEEDHDHVRRWFRTLLTPGPGEPPSRRGRPRRTRSSPTSPIWRRRSDATPATTS